MRRRNSLLLVGAVALLGTMAAVSAEDAKRDAKGVLTISGNEARLRSIVVSPDGKTIYSLANDKVLAAWDAQSGKERWKVKTDIVANGPNMLMVWDNGKQLMAGQNGHLFDATTGKPGAKLDYVNGGRVAGNGKIMAVVDGAGKRKVYIFEPGALKATKSIPTTETERELVMSADGKFVAWLEYAKVRVASVADAQVKTELEVVQEAKVSGLSPDGKLIAIASMRELGMFEVESKKKLWTVDHFGSERIVFSPDGKQLVASGMIDNKSVAIVRDAKTGKALGYIPEVNNFAPTLVFMPDGKSIVVPSNNQIRVVPIDALDPIKN